MFLKQLLMHFEEVRLEEHYRVVDKQQEFAEGQMNYFEQGFSSFSIAARFSTFEASQAAAEPLRSLVYPLNREHQLEPVSKLFTKSM